MSQGSRVTDSYLKWQSIWSSSNYTWEDAVYNLMRQSLDSFLPKLRIICVHVGYPGTRRHKYPLCDYKQGHPDLNMIHALANGYLMKRRELNTAKPTKIERKRTNNKNQIKGRDQN